MTQTNTFPDLGLGRRPSVPDERNQNFRAVAGKEASILIRKTWPTAQVFDQGPTSMCVAYSGIAALVAAPNVNFPNMTFETLYNECRKNDRWPGENYDGTSVHGLCIVLKKLGFITEYRWATKVEQLADYVLTKGPAVVGTTWTQDMFTPDKEGFIHVGGDVAGGHAYLIVGCDREKKCPNGKKGAFRKLGSWGRGWADNGRAWIGFDDMAALIADDGEIAMFAEAKLN